MILLQNKNLKKSQIGCLVFIIMVILCIINILIIGHYKDLIHCLLALIFLIVPSIIEKRLKINIPSITLIMIYTLIFSTAILGEVYDFYIYYFWWDILVHFSSGILCTIIGLGIFKILNKPYKIINSILFAFCFSMTLATLWEFTEYSLDKYLYSDMQKDTYVKTISSVNIDLSKNGEPVKINNIAKTILYDKDGNELAVIEAGYLDIGLNDTMGDLLACFNGSIICSFISYFYLKKDRKSFAILT